MPLLPMTRRSSPLACNRSPNEVLPTTIPLFILRIKLLIVENCRCRRRNSIVKSFPPWPTLSVHVATKSDVRNAGVLESRGLGSSDTNRSKFQVQTNLVYYLSDYILVDWNGFEAPSITYIITVVDRCDHHAWQWQFTNTLFQPANEYY